MMSPTRPHSILRRSRLAVLGVAVAMGAVVLAPSPANAADATVTDGPGLLTAVATGGTITLGASFNLGESLPITATTTLDLAGEYLITESISIADNVELTIKDSVGGGILNAFAYVYGEDPGIRVADEGKLTIESGKVSARGAGGESAGIGGGQEQSGGTIVINGGTVYSESGGNGAGIGAGMYGDWASVTINGGKVRGVGRGNAAGIGSGESGSYPSITVNGGEVTGESTGMGAGIGTGVIGYGPTITINDGTVTAIGSARGAGIGSGGPSYNGGFSDAGTITIRGGTVTATGGSSGGAGIGSGGMGGYTSWDDNATIVITGGTVRAVGGTFADGGGAGIGTGRNGGSSLVTIGPDAVVSAKGGLNASAIGVGTGADSRYYEMTIDGEVTVDDDSAIIVPTDRFVRGTGLTEGSGVIHNHGTILADAGPGWTIDDHNYLVTFVANYSSADPAQTEVRVLSDRMDRGERQFPVISRTGWMLGSWNTAADGSGDDFTRSTVLSGPVTVYAQWEEFDHLTITPESPTVTAPDDLDFTVHAFGPGETDLGDVTDRVGFTSDNPDDDVTGNNIFFYRAGERTVTAALITDPTARVSTTVTVEPGPMTFIELRLSATTVPQGGGVTAQVVGFDMFGNETGDLTSVAELESDHPDDIIEGARVTFPHASPHVITAKLEIGEIVYRDSETVEVTAAVPDPDPDTTPDAGLAATGSELLPGAAAAILLLALGGILLLYRRRRA